jgi:hypothetical protein
LKHLENNLQVRLFIKDHQKIALARYLLSKPL